MSRRAWFVPDTAGSDDLAPVQCTCGSYDVRVRDSWAATADKRAGVRLECIGCSRQWKVIGRAPVRALLMKRSDMSENA